MPECTCHGKNPECSFCGGWGFIGDEIRRSELIETLAGRVSARPTTLAPKQGNPKLFCSAVHFAERTKVSGHELDLLPVWPYGTQLRCANSRKMPVLKTGQVYVVIGEPRYMPLGPEVQVAPLNGHMTIWVPCCRFVQIETGNEVDSHQHG